MATNSASQKEAKEAVKAILDTITGVGKVEARYGGSETWIDTARPKQAFWEVTYRGAQESGGGIGLQAIETMRIWVEGWMPFSYSDRTEDTWDALLDSVRDTLRTYPTLACEIEGVRGSRLPFYQENAIRPYSDTKSTKLCHYARIELQVDRWFTYSVASSLP